MKLFSLLLLLLASCGYRFQQDEDAAHDVHTITIPYVKGDSEGMFTNELIRTLSASGYFVCVQNGGEYTLNAVLVQDENERIGYRYDRHGRTGKLRHRLEADENRRSVTAEITLIDSRTDQILIEPTKVVAMLEYDYIDSNSIRDLVFIDKHGIPRRSLTFSLGQLDSIEGAQDSSSPLVYKLLSRKILDGLIDLKL